MRAALLAIAVLAETSGIMMPEEVWQNIFQHEYRAYQKRIPETLQGTTHVDLLSKQAPELWSSLPSEREKLTAFYGLMETDLQMLTTGEKQAAPVLERIRDKMETVPVLAKKIQAYETYHTEYETKQKKFAPLHEEFMEFVTWRESHMENEDSSGIPEPTEEQIALSRNHFQKRQDLIKHRAKMEWTSTEVTALRRVMGMHLVTVLDLDPAIADQIVPPSSLTKKKR